MKLTDVISPKEFIDAMSGPDSKERRKQCIEECQPFDDALMEAGFLETHTPHDAATVLATINCINRALYRQKVTA